MELMEPILPYLTLVISIVTLLLVVFYYQNSKRRLEMVVEELQEQNSKLSEKIKNIATKDDLNIETKTDFSNFVDKTDIINISNRITDLREEIATLTDASKISLDKPKSALNGHKAEKELEVYEKIWQATGNLYYSVEKLQPSGEAGNKGEIWKQKYDEVALNYQKLWREAENQRIFYPKELYQQLQNMLREVKNEVVLLESLGKWSDTMPLNERAQAAENLEKIRGEVERIHNFMRIRLNQL